MPPTENDQPPRREKMLHDQNFSFVSFIIFAFSGVQRVAVVPSVRPLGDGRPRIQFFFQARGLEGRDQNRVFTLFQILKQIVVDFPHEAPPIAFLTGSILSAWYTFFMTIARSSKHIGKTNKTGGGNFDVEKAGKKEQRARRKFRDL
jgi:hypothetical protein